MHSAWFRSTFITVFKFLQIKEGRPNFWGVPILQKVWIIWSSVLDFNFKRFIVPNSLSFSRFQYILHDSGVLSSESSNIFKLKMGDLISGGTQFCRMSQLFGPAFCISFLKVFQNKILRHSLDFNAFCMILGYFSQGLEFSTKQRGDT